MKRFFINTTICSLGILVGLSLGKLSFAQPSPYPLAYATIESSIEWKVRGQKPERIDRVTTNISNPVSYCTFLEMLSFKGDRSHYVVVKCRVVEWYKYEI